MIITKKTIARRSFLRGAGAVVALPFLDAMVPALKAATSTAVPRLGFFYSPNGIYPSSFHPGAAGRNFEFTPVLKPLEPHRDHINVLTGLSNLGATSPKDGGGSHTRAHAGWLNGTLVKKTEGSDLSAGKTVDQYAADVLGANSPLRSLELTTESNIMAGLCENNYSCTYRNSTSWLTATTPLPHEENPRLVFQRLFGGENTPQQRTRELQTDRSILDSVVGDLSRLQRRLGIGDRRMVDDYLTSIREVEARIQRVEKNNTLAPDPALARPSGVPEEFDEHVKLLFDLLYLAYRGDITRVSCTQLARENSGRTYPQIGVNGGHHSISHHDQDPQKIAQQVKIDTYHMSLFAHMVQKMKETPDGDGTLLDHSILLYGGGLGDGNMHLFSNLPVVVAGGGCGTIEGGRHLVFEKDTPFMNLGLSLLEKLNIQVDRIGDSTGGLSSL